jgi:hypothetical protein
MKRDDTEFNLTDATQSVNERQGRLEEPEAQKYACKLALGTARASVASGRSAGF